AKNKTNGKFRNRENEILFIDARKMGKMINRRNRILRDGSDGDINEIKIIADTYHKWRNTNGGYADISGFCKSATLEEVRQNNYVLMPGRYVGTEDEQINDIPFDEKMKSLTVKLAEQFAKDNELENTI